MNSIVLEGLVGSGELWLDIMKIICGDTQENWMIDLGCHKAPYSPLLGFKHRNYLDIQNRPLDHTEEQQYFIQAEIADFLKRMHRGRFVFILSDTIEHLTIKQGYEVIELMCQKGHKSIIFTPLGDYMLETEPTENPDSHRSGWIPEMLSGYASIVLPNFHEALGKGAFFAFNCNPIETERILNEITQKYVQSRID
jgi:hypothetical protein